MLDEARSGDEKGPAGRKGAIHARSRQHRLAESMYGAPGTTGPSRASADPVWPDPHRLAATTVNEWPTMDQSLINCDSAAASSIRADAVSTSDCPPGAELIVKS